MVGTDVSPPPIIWHDFTVPNAGSLPKNSLVHRPDPETDFLTQRESAPYLTIWVPVTENVPPSMATVDNRLLDAFNALESVTAARSPRSVTVPPPPPPQALRTAAKSVQRGMKPRDVDRKSFAMILVAREK